MCVCRRVIVTSWTRKREGWKEGRNLTFSLDSAGHHLPYRSPQLDMPRVLKDAGVAT